MRLIHAILICLLGLSAILVWLMLIPEAEMARGVAHPQFTAMSLGGDGERAWSIFWPIFLWQCLSIFMAHFLFALSFAPKRRRSVRPWLIVSCVVNLVVWGALMLTYKQVLDTGTTAYVLGFPITSSWMIYGVWAGFLIPCALYMFGFDRFIYSTEDEAKFQDILKEKHQAD